MTWIDEVLQQHDELESPKSFWYWSSLCAISAVVKDNVWLPEGGAWKLYPNIYVLLYADSAVGKGPPIALAHKLVKNVNNTKIISGRSSIQGILGKLSRGESKPGGRIDKGSSGFIVASEFSSALVHDPAAMDILTDLFDRIWRIGEWESLLKQEQFHLRDPTVSLLAGINEAHFNSLMESKDVFGGFLGRTFLISESITHTLNPLIDDLENPPDVDYLVKHLKELSKLRGQFKTLQNTKAGECYKDWYMNFYQVFQDQNIEDKTGTIRRTRDAVKKVAMLLSLSHSTDLTIHLPQMEESIAVCEKLIINVRKTTHGKKGMSSFAAHKALIINELLTRETHEVTRKILQKKFWIHFNIEEQDLIMKSFEVAGLIESRIVGNNTIYTMPPEEAEKYERLLAGKGGG